MNDLSDAELLRRFARDDSEAAFAVLVERYPEFSFFRRRTRECLTSPARPGHFPRRFFIILARKAGALDSKTVLSGWLYHTARLTAAKFQQGRMASCPRREQEAFMQAETNDHTSEIAWRELSPELETAMARLRPRQNRDALVMRYFQNRSMATK